MSDLRDYNSSQWWFKELECIWNADLGSAITHDMKRAAKVAINMVKEVEALHFKDPEAWREEYRKKQAAGVKFQRKSCGEWVHPINMLDFSGKKEDYRELPQPLPLPHAAERALWKAQRVAGTNEVWQAFSRLSKTWCDLDNEPKWYSDTEYRVKPMKLTARIIRMGVYKTAYYWEFFGTREEYRAECEKYGYVVISEINEVKTTVKYYFALMKNSAGEISVKWCDESNLSALEKMGSGWGGHTIIGDIEEREIEA